MHSADHNTVDIGDSLYVMQFQFRAQTAAPPAVLYHLAWIPYVVDMVYVNNILLLTAAKNSPDIVDVSKVDFTSLGKTTVT